MQELKTGIIEGFKDRLSNPFYGYLLIAWSVINWKIIYTTLFVSNESIIQKSNLLKTDYIGLFVRDAGWLYLAVLPAVSAVFLIWLAPYFTNLAHKAVYINKWKLVRIEEKEKQKFTSLRLETVEKEINVQELYDKHPIVLWEKEFTEFKKNSLFSKFREIVEGYYDHGGKTESYEPLTETTVMIVNKTILAFAHANELITFSNGSHTYFELTDKGKYFVAQYTKELGLRK